MKQFFKFTFASMVGFLLSLFLVFLLFIMFTFFIVSSVDDGGTVTISDKTILKIKLDYDVPERTSLESFNSFDVIPSLTKNIGLNDITKAIKKAKSDAKISGIFLDLDNTSVGGLAKIDAIRNPLIDFKSSGKFILAHGNSISEKSYYLASVADSIFLTPTGSFEFDGFAIEMMFFKKALDKLEVEPQIFQHGKYKSATEPFRLSKMSDENKTQLQEYLTSVYDNFISNISTSTKLQKEKLVGLADNLQINSAEDAYNFGLVDSLIYSDQVDFLLRNLVGIESKRKIKTVNLKKYLRTNFESNSSKNRIAVIYADGEITNRKGNEHEIGTGNISKSIITARKNKNIKAIVLRVNSPGGSPLTSDMIWREIILTKKVKPIIVSMSDYAASGGYYIACAADTIVAEPTTLTGSIGVFGIIPNTQKFFNNKLGVTFDRVGTNKNSGMMTMSKPLNKSQRKYIQNQVEEIYVDFASRVAEGRGMTFKQVDEIAQGRIWSGLQAKEIGLVDELGGLDVAIDIAARKANIDSYKILEYPKQKEAFEKFMEILSSDISVNLFDFQKPFDNVAKVSKALKYTGIQTRLPFEFEIN
ncbi:MAG: signal peptide peptidase SppA [Ignavibacteriae bacterium]|nr:signal peptide peptidase SppA [Ignavibacteriota bacterium]